jgi:hypothetical protein
MLSSAANICGFAPAVTAVDDHITNDRCVPISEVLTEIFSVGFEGTQTRLQLEATITPQQKIQTRE